MDLSRKPRYFIFRYLSIFYINDGKQNKARIVIDKGTVVIYIRQEGEIHIYLVITECPDLFFVLSWNYLT